MTPIDSLAWPGVPKPPYIHDGDRVLVKDDGCQVSGVVERWYDASVLINTLDLARGGRGLFSARRRHHRSNFPRPS